MSQTTIEEIAVSDIVQIDIHEHVMDALKLLYESGKRSVIVSDEGSGYYALSIGVIAQQQNLDNVVDKRLQALMLPKVKAFAHNEPVNDVYFSLETHDRVVVVTEKDRLQSVVSYNDIVAHINPKEFFAHENIESIFLRNRYTKVALGATVGEVIGMFKGRYDESMIVYDEYDPVGIITSKDIIKALIDKVNLECSIQSIMSKPIKTIPSNTSLKEALYFIESHAFRRVVVSGAEGRILGIVSKSDIYSLLKNKWIDKTLQNEMILDGINKTLRDQMCYDHLTKIYNRVKFDDIIEHEKNVADRYKNTPFSLALFDIDNFKSINDTYGHHVGDEVLVKFAQILKRNSRNSDVVARWGGEEFAIILSNTSQQEAGMAADKIRKAVGKERFESVGNVTVSVGVSEYKHEKLALLFERTDRALYQAKRGGKNQTVTL
jgi:diguanylate cyclase (GGDEF)-like protein